MISMSWNYLLGWLGTRWDSIETRATFDDKNSRKWSVKLMDENLGPPIPFIFESPLSIVARGCTSADVRNESLM